MIDVIVLSQICLQYLLGNRTLGAALRISTQIPLRPYPCTEDRQATTLACWSTSRAKRIFDVTAALLAILLSAPLLLAIACVVQCTSTGPALFRQRRAGLGQRSFTIYKFRTMCDGADLCGPSVTRASDRRITAVGAVLRRFKLDELPQLFNVLRGDMSMVGPRPKLHQHERMQLFCRPGITGAATVAFAREEELLASIPEDEVETYTINVLNRLKADIDTEYARNATLVSDCLILISTLRRKRTTEMRTEMLFQQAECSD